MASRRGGCQMKLPGRTRRGCWLMATAQAVAVMPMLLASGTARAQDTLVECDVVEPPVTTPKPHVAGAAHHHLHRHIPGHRPPLFPRLLVAKPIIQPAAFPTIVCHE